MQALLDLIFGVEGSVSEAAQRLGYTTYKAFFHFLIYLWELM